MSEIFFFRADNKESTRLDVFLAESVEELSRAHALKLIEAGQVTVNGLIEMKGKRTVKDGDEIAVTIPDPQPIEMIAENIPLDIVYQDEWLAVVNKQQGLTVHPANNVFSGTLVNALLYHLGDLSGINGDLRPGIVHRLDKDTSGLMVVAKNDFAHVALSRQIAAKECRRIYWALLEGVLKEDEGGIDKPIGRSLADRKIMAIRADGRNAVTLFRVLERFDKNTLVEFELKTGRTHQIRVHAKFLGHPVVGDRVYGYKNQRFRLDGQLLHAKKLSFKHPKTGETLSFECDLPDYFKKILNVLS